MTYINWDSSPIDGVDDGVYFTFEGIKIPTYGLNGGADYTGGQIGGSTLDVSGQPLTPVYDDRIDKLFWFHDQAYDLAPGVDVLPEADLHLAARLVKLHDSQLADPEARLYAGVTTLVMLERVEQSDPGLVAPKTAVRFAADAAHNIATGFAGLNGYEQFQALNLLAQFGAAGLTQSSSALSSTALPSIQPAIADAGQAVQQVVSSATETVQSLVNPVQSFFDAHWHA
jgi:hypothetical protein